MCELQLALSILPSLWLCLPQSMENESMDHGWQITNKK